MLQRRTRAMVGVLGFVLVIMGLVGQAQAKNEKGEDRKHQASRFVVLPPDNLWVLDTTTSLRWQKAPGNEPLPWLTASAYCPTLGGGSRLPEVKELISLVDYSVANPGPVLPADNPFLNVVNGSNWSATPYAGNPANAWYVDFGQGNVNTIGKTGIGYAWCVR